ncbi:divalent metal cation transporter [Asticcacaulis sp.]|uniref:NRAMP family divalent metal transporter n=1 Tax=Asticcacaulis sp. TaxID=1872648 RepID=UPI002C823E78|nr:divalent metal cation transporter [Asticcacaulis sp.]HTM79949.1 divalent metal cation transporter [Asticcacaulis sp.]
MPDTDTQKEKPKSLKALWKLLGPGLVTGASDDDPSGIATYSQAGAQYGLTTLWTALITFPLMAAVQEMCARIGVVTAQGLTGILRKTYPKPVLWLMVLFSFPAIILNIGADIAGMGAVANLIFPAISPIFFSVAFTILLLIAIIALPYAKFAAVLKWLCVILLVYLVVPFLVKTDWLSVAKHTVIPTVQFNKDYVSVLVAILGTTISPYLFFWQTTMEVEAMKHDRHVVVDKRYIKDVGFDVDMGMLFSNIVMYFIILTTGTVLFNAGIHQIDTVEQAAKALEPVAGAAAYYLFAIGVIGTGFLAIPVLSGSLSYIISETFGWQEGLDKRLRDAPAFYAVIVVSLLIGLGINYIGISPIQALIWSAILYGITSPVIIAIVLHISNNTAVMGTFTNGVWSNIFGGLALLLMTVAAGFMLYFQFFG